MTLAVPPLRDRVSDRAHRLGIALAPGELEDLEEYLLLLERWNQTINLTALPLDGFPDITLDRLVMEPLVAARHIDNAPASWIDLGSGGGSPAIPLKIVRPALGLTMVESRSRKGAFLRETVRTLGLADVVVLTERFQQLAGPSKSQLVDLITVRAVRISADLMTTSSSLLKPEGRLFLFAAGSTIQSGTTRGFRLVEEVLLPTPRAVLRVLEKTAALDKSLPGGVARRR